MMKINVFNVSIITWGQAGGYHSRYQSNDAGAFWSISYPAFVCNYFFQSNVEGGGGATNDLFTEETINLEYLYIMQWTGQW